MLGTESFFNTTYRSHGPIYVPNDTTPLFSRVHSAVDVAEGKRRSIYIREVQPSAADAVLWTRPQGKA